MTTPNDLPASRVCDFNKIRSYLLDAGYPIDGDAMLTVDAVENSLSSSVPGDVAAVLAKTPTEPNGDCAYRMDGYYIHFDMTGIDIIDNILSAVACAEKAYHHTESWNDDTNPESYGDRLRGANPVHWIQNAAREARDRIERALASPQCVPVEALGRDAPDELTEYVEDYEYRSDEGSYAPNERERLLIEDAIRGWEDRTTAAPAPASVAGGLTADDVQWIVNDNAELGVMIHGKAFFLYKGDSLVYDDAKHDNGMPMYYRTVGKREFGECAHPINHSDYSKIGTVSLDDSDRWQLLPPTTPDTQPTRATR